MSETEKMNAQHRLWAGTAAIWAGVSVSGNLIAAIAKFQVETLDLSMALQVGRAQFLWNGYAEYLCIVMIVMGLIWHVRFLPPLLAGAIAILMIQKIGLTRLLQARSDLIIAGLSPDHSNVHVLFAVLEVLKFICLLVYSSRTLAQPSIHPEIACAQQKNPAL